MRVWIINLFSDLPGEGATEGRFIALARCFAGDGHDVTFWTMDFHHRRKALRGADVAAKAQRIIEALNLEGTLTIRMIPVRHYSKNISLRRLRSHLSFSKQLLKATKSVPDDSSPDTIIVSSPPLEAGIAGLNLGQRFTCPVVVDLTDLWPHTFERLLPGSETTRRLLGRVAFAPLYHAAHRLYRKASLVTAVSQEYLDDVSSVAPDQQTHLCYIGGRVNEPTRGVEPGEPIRFVYVGAMTGSYDLETVVDAASQLKEQGCKFEVHFAGSGAQEPRLIERVKSEGLQSVFHFHGFLRAEELEGLLTRMDVGLNCICRGLAITMPHKLSDYICAGLPVVNSLEGEAHDLLQNANCGFFYEPGDPTSLASAMVEYLESEFLIQQKRAAHALARAKFDRAETYLRWANVILHQ